MLILLLISSPTWALGSTERDVLAVIGGIFLVDQVAQRSHRQQHQNYPPSERTAPRLHRYESDLDRAYRMGQQQRMLDQRRQMQLERAYDCGYYGDCYR